MADIRTRRRPLTLLTIVVVAQVLLLAFQVRHTAGSQGRDIPLVRYWAVEVIMPFERVGSSVFSGLGGFWSGYVDVHGERNENKRLLAENGELKLRNRELETEAEEARRLNDLLEFRKQHPESPMLTAQVTGSSSAMLAAHVIGGSADPNSHTIFINHGAGDLIRRNMAVITPDGIVGKIVEVFPNASEVLLINDRESGVGAMFVDTRTHGIVKGNGSPYPEMDYIVNDEKVHVGDPIVTSGEDRIFPKGLPVGVVSSTKPANPFQIIKIRSAARLDRLEDVLVLLTEKELNLKEAASTAAVPEGASAAANSSPAQASAAPGKTSTAAKTPPAVSRSGPTKR
jgi:rod shape-determining protein MreC